MNRIPKFLTLELTNLCQLACKGCGSEQDVYPKGFMDKAFYKRMIDKAADEGLQDKMIIVPYANGEPLLHPDILELMRYTTAKGFKTYITTNGMIWNQDLFRWMLTEPLYYQTIFSLDGLWDKGNVVKARPGSNETRVRLTIEAFLKLKVKLGSSLDVFVKMVERGQDFGEQERYIDYWLRQEGLSCVILGKMLNTTPTEGMRLYPCQYPDDTFMLVRWNQQPTLCMYRQEVMNDQVRPMPKMRDDQGIVDYFNSGVYKEFHEEQARGEFKGPCKNCGIAYTGTGWKGTIHFRDPKLIQAPIYYRSDYYNSMFSLVDKSRPDMWYGYTPLSEAPRGREWLSTEVSPQDPAPRAPAKDE
jgi:organic radical activating enzyme